jgi:hypothetical protein
VIYLWGHYVMASNGWPTLAGENYLSEHHQRSAQHQVPAKQPGFVACASSHGHVAQFAVQVSLSLACFACFMYANPGRDGFTDQLTRVARAHRARALPARVVIHHNIQLSSFIRVWGPECILAQLRNLKS